MSKVSKHCSILNYIRHADEELYELIQELCIGRILVPRKGSPGVTFLRPDKSLLKEIKSMASGDNPEEAVDAIQALLLLDHLPTVDDFGDKKSDIPTFHRKKLQVVSVDGSKVVLKNGAEITIDKDFAARGDRSNIAVYIISKALVPVDGDTADFSNATEKKAKKGGADLDGNRQDLFERVLNETCEESKSSREPAMELLVALHKWASKQGSPAGLAELIASQVSYDALASLAIVLQPYKKRPPFYLKDEDLVAFRNVVYGTNKDLIKSIPVYSFSADAADYYNNLVGTKHPAAEDIHNLIVNVSSSVAKTNVISKLQNFYDGNKIPSSKLPAMRTAGVVSVKQMFAEAELRVLSAVLFDNEMQPSCDEAKKLYENCTLDEPYMCSNKEIIANSNVGFYFSTVYLIARSNALLYVPGIEGEKIDQIANEDAIINVDASLGNSRKSKRAGSQEMIVQLRRQFTD